MDIVFLEEPVEIVFMEDISKQARSNKKARAKNSEIFLNNSKVITSTRHILKNGETAKYVCDQMLKFSDMSIFFGSRMFLVKSEILFKEDLKPLISHIRYLAHNMMPVLYLYLVIQEPKSLEIDFRDYMKELASIEHPRNVKLCAYGQWVSEFDEEELEAMLVE